MFKNFPTSEVYTKRLVLITT